MCYNFTMVQTHKRCGGRVNGCGKVKPLSEFKESGSSKTGRGAVCIECIESKNQEAVAERLKKKNSKTCNKCGSSYVLPDSCTPCQVPPTFLSCYTCKEVLPVAELNSNRQCVECRREQDRKVTQKRRERTESQILQDRRRLRPTGRKICPGCSKEFALEEFGRNRNTADGCGGRCKKCLRNKNAKRANVLSARSVEQVEQDRARIRPEGVKRCRSCSEAKTFGNFSLSLRNADGLFDICKACVSDATATRANVMSQLVHLYGGVCLHPDCNSRDLTIDHVVPLKMGGANDIGNYQLLCRSHNSRKGASHVDYRGI